MEINAEEFYFVRHGQTDANVGHWKDFPETIPLNPTGREQALQIRPIIATLPIKTICHSPLNRAVETKEIIASDLDVDHVEIPELGECAGTLWLDLVRWETEKKLPIPPKIEEFINRVRIGLVRALEQPGPVLIVAHGGVHWAICHHLCDTLHRRIDNCVPLHFQKHPTQWVAQPLALV